MSRADRHNEIEINLMKNGSLSYLFGGKRVTIPRGGLAVFWAAIPHQIIASSGDREYYVVTIPLTWFLQCCLPAKLVDRLLGGSFLRDPSGQRSDLDLQLFQSWTDDRVRKPNNKDTAIRLELHARLLRLADELPAFESKDTENSPKALLGTGGVGKVEQLAGYIAQHYQEPLLIEDVARKVGLHPNYAMNLFKKTFHLTINDYVTQHRLSHAQRLLATTNDKIVDIALDAGYPTLSRFYEAFKRSCRCSPSIYRREHRIAD